MSCFLPTHSRVLTLCLATDDDSPGAAELIRTTGRRQRTDCIDQSLFKINLSAAIHLRERLRLRYRRCSREPPFPHLARLE